MFDVSAANLMAEREAAVQNRDAYIEGVPGRKSRFHGPHYKTAKASKDSTGEHDAENHIFEFLSLTVPRKVWGTPRVKIGTRRTGSQREVAKALQYAVNRWIEDSKFSVLVDKAAYDEGLGYAVLISSLSPRPGLHEPEDPVLWPQINRLSPRAFGWDPCALSFEECRYLFHDIVRDKGSLLDEAKANPEAGWNVELIQTLSADTDVENLRPNSQLTPKRNDIVISEIWIPEYQLPDAPGPEEGFHGTIFTVASVTGWPDGKQKGYIRKPRPYYGPRQGPYTLIGTYVVPDEVAPLTSIVAVEEQTNELNAHVRAASQSARSYKRLALVDSTNPKLPAAIKNGIHEHVIPVQGFKPDSVASLEIGGTTQHELAMIEMLRNRLDRNSGIDEVQRGNSSGGSTATAVAVANEASTARQGYAVMKFRRGIERALMTVAYYCYHVDEIKFPLGTEAAAEFGMDEPWFHGGDPADGSGSSFDDLELELEVGSMDKTSESAHQRRAQILLELSTTVGLIIPQAPWLDWKFILDSVGDSIGIPDLSQILNVELAAQAAVLQMQAMTKQDSQPRTGRDLGAAGSAQRSSGGQGKPMTTPRMTTPAQQSAGPRAQSKKPATAGAKR